MEVLKAIEQRRSIRAYREEEIPRSLIEEILWAGLLAPSSKNRQPWKFIVVTGEAKREMTAVMAAGLEREKETPLLPGSRGYLKGAEYTRRVMEQAPVVIFVVNPMGVGPEAVLTPEERVYEICNAQLVGAAMENMTLTAVELGLGSLWICDTYLPAGS